MDGPVGHLFQPDPVVAGDDQGAAPFPPGPKRGLRISRAEAVSTLAVGSSKSSTAGLRISREARATLWVSPPERLVQVPERRQSRPEGQGPTQVLRA